MLNSNYSNIASATTSDQQLAAPTNLVATAVSSSQINLAWTSHSNSLESGFAVERATAATGPWTLIATVGKNVTAFNNTGLTANTTYYFRTKANA